MSSKFRITGADKQSEAWRKIEEHLKQKIEDYRSDLEKPNKPPSALNDDVLRGCILAYRRLLAKADEVIVDENDGT